MDNSCMAGNAPDSTTCTASGNKPGKCSSGACMCEPQCQGRQCGDNGCGGSCGSCTGGTKCSSSFQCVGCLSSSDCKSSNPCETGTCSGGSCSLNPVDGGACNGTGTCRNGSCCQPSCVGRCGGDDNGCGGRCADPCSGKKCTNGVCCGPSCQGKCGGESDGCGGQCPPVSCTGGNVCVGGHCSVCPPNKTGCGYSAGIVDCWGCTRPVMQGQGPDTVIVYRCNADGSAFSAVNYCAVADCNPTETETATCLGNDSAGACSFTGGKGPGGTCAP
jgi:hypothetical protein